VAIFGSRNFIFIYNRNKITSVMMNMHTLKNNLDTDTIPYNLELIRTKSFWICPDQTKTNTEDIPPSRVLTRNKSIWICPDQTETIPANLLLTRNKSIWICPDQKIMSF
jgi:hypothetical protein